VHIGLGLNGTAQRGTHSTAQHSTAQFRTGSILEFVIYTLCMRVKSKINKNKKIVKLNDLVIKTITSDETLDTFFFFRAIWMD
jgi:hypothetical protein